MSVILAYVFVGICSVILIIFAIKGSFCDHEYYKIEEGKDYMIARCFKCSDKIKITWRYGKR